MPLPALNRTDRSPPDSYRKIASLFGAGTVALGLLGLSGWVLGMPLLASIRSSYIPMAPFTAIAFICLGGLLLVHSAGSPQGPAGMLAVVFSGLLSAYGLIELVESLGMPVLALEESLFPETPILGAVPTGRMSPATAALLFISGAVVPMLFLRRRGGKRQKLFGNLAGCLGVLVTMVGTVFVLSYLHGAPILYGTTTIPMAATTAIAFLLLGTGQVLAAGPDGFPSRFFAGPSTRARLRRAFVSTTIGVVVAIDLLHVYAHQVFFDDNAFMSGFSTTIFLVIAGLVIARVALKVGDDMDRSERDRREVEGRLRESEDRFRDLVDHSQDLICTHDLEGRILSVNPWAATVMGYTPDELLRMNFRDFLVPETRHEVGKYLEDIRANGTARGLMWVQTRKGERRVWEYKNTLRTDGVAEPIVRGMAQDITDRKRAEKALRESEEKFRVIFEGSKDGIILADVESKKFYTANKTFCGMLGYSLDEVRDLCVADIHPVEDLPRLLDAFEREAKRESLLEGDIPVRRKDGSVFWAEITASPVTISGKKYLLGSFRDATQRLSLEKQVRKAQKMEAVGTLAGGIAHDFNNALTGIVGFGELLRQRMAGDEQALHDLDEILRCAQRGATLTRQLLTFARCQVIEPVNLSLSALVGDLMTLVGRLVGEHVEVTTSLKKSVPTIYADPGQIEQVVMNVCLNARDAMPEGGRLAVETEDVCLEEEYVRRNPYMRTGRYALLTVSDTGIGMDEKTRERVFDPFFTTKGPDKGTGLGLAMVYGIVKQHNGFIHLYSEPGKGTVLKVYLPAVDAKPDSVSAKHREGIVCGGTETILLAEDEEPIRALAERALKGFGYTVLAARNGEEAVEIFRRNKEIALVVLDVVMPRKGGKEAFVEMRKQAPRLKAIFMSGYSIDGIHDSFVLTAGMPFLQKPFGPTMLAKKIREVLDTR